MGTSAPTLVDRVRSGLQCGLEQPPDPRPTDAALGVSPATAPAQPELHALLRVVRTQSATERPPRSSADSRGPPTLSSPGFARTLSTALPDRPTFFFFWVQGGEGETEEERRLELRWPEPRESGMPDLWRRRLRRTGEDDAAAP